MIDPETLKKHNLKAVPFECIGEGETFNIDVDFWLYPYYEFTRKIVDGQVWFADDRMNSSPLCDEHITVYVPVWRPCREVAKIKGNRGLSNRNKAIMNAWGYDTINL